MKMWVMSWLDTCSAIRQNGKRKSNSEARIRQELATEKKMMQVSIATLSPIPNP
jgi:hypothetical protein